MVKKITEPAKSIFRFNSPQAQDILHSTPWGLGRCFISEVLYRGGMLKTVSFWWSHVPGGLGSTGGEWFVALTVVWAVALSSGCGGRGEVLLELV